MHQDHCSPRVISLKSAFPMLGQALTFFQDLLSCLLPQVAYPEHPIEIVTHLPHSTVRLIPLTRFYLLSFSKYLSTSNKLSDLLPNNVRVVIVCLLLVQKLPHHMAVSISSTCLEQYLSEWLNYEILCTLCFKHSGSLLWLPPSFLSRATETEFKETLELQEMSMKLWLREHWNNIW